jgi:glutamate synthase (NADPH/NADH) large chain
VNERPVATLRDLLVLKQGTTPVALEQVEPAAKLFPRFDSAAMSSARWPRGARGAGHRDEPPRRSSNSGEGGEDPKRYGTEKNSQDQAGGLGALRRHPGTT